jgi:hypothetical protein
MRSKRSIWTGILSLVVLATLAGKAEACRYYWAHYCGYYPYAIGYRPAPTACYGCGGYCGGGAYIPWHKHHWCFPIIRHLCAKCAAHTAWRYGCGYGCTAPCYGDCGSGCGCDTYAACGGSASYGGEASGSAMPVGLPSEAQIISDRVLGEGAEPEAAEGQSADANQANFHLASYRKAGNAAFQNGLDSLRKGSKTEALDAFDTAAQADPQNAMYHYHRALALYDLSRPDAAAYALRQAVQAEQREPVKDWGKRMERVQGRGRVWIEKARREAGLVR